MPAMKVRLKIAMRPGVDLEVQEASVAELNDLFDSLRNPAVEWEGATHEQLVEIGRALGIPEASLLNRKHATIPLHAGIRQVAESAISARDFSRKTTLGLAAKVDSMRPIVEAASAYVRLPNQETHAALVSALAAYDSAENEGDSNASPSAEGSTVSPSKEGDSNASPSNTVCSDGDDCPDKDLHRRTVCSVCGADVEGKIGAMVPDEHRCSAPQTHWRRPVIVANVPRG